MGDLVQSTPAITGLRKQYPNACITLLVTSTFEEFSRKIPCIDKIIVFDIQQVIKNETIKSLVWVEVYKYLEYFLCNLKSIKFDLLINLSHSKLSALMISYLKIGNIRGFGCNENGERMTFNPWMQYFGIEPFNRLYNPFNLVEIFTRSAGVTPEDNPIQLSIDDENSSIKHILKNNNIRDDDIVIGIQAGSSLEVRRWSPEYFAALVNGLIDNLGAKIVLLGVKEEDVLADKIISISNYPTKILNLVGETNIDQLTALVQRCIYVIGNDTGTMHVAAAVGTTTVGLFFAHAHPYETAPYSAGHLIFQARIPCAPCSYGVECNNVICIRKVNPKHLISMIQNHFTYGYWRLTEDASSSDELNIYETCLGNDRRLRLRPLVKHNLTIVDIFREIYSEHWLNFLDLAEIGKTNCSDVASLLLREYDCSNINILIKQIEVKYLALMEIKEFANRGIYIADKIIRLHSENTVTQYEEIKHLCDEIEMLDDRINQTGFIHPEIKPIVDIFSKRKENFQGNDPIKLSKETQKCYEMLIDEAGSFYSLLESTCEKIRMVDVDTCYAAVSSINVEVPGR